MFTSLEKLLATLDDQLKTEEGIRITVLSLEDIAYLGAAALLTGITLIVINKKIIK